VNITLPVTFIPKYMNVSQSFEWWGCCLDVRNFPALCWWGKITC